MRRGGFLLKLTRWMLAALALAALVYACQGTLRSPAPAPERPSPARWSPDDVNVAWLGHASVLVELAGARLLTDPVFFDRIGVSVGPVTLGPKRLVASALAPGDLPPLDAVLLSHAHMDSLDRPSLRAVAEKWGQTPFSPASLLITPERTRDLVDDLGFERVVELKWGQSIQVGEVAIEAVRLAHWGRRWPWERWRGYNGYLISRGDVTILFASDTAYTPAIGELAKQRRITAAIIGNGAYDPWIRNHANPEQVWQMFRESGARYLLPIHWGTFRLGKEPVDEAMERLFLAAGPESGKIVIRRIGQTWTLNTEQAVALRPR